MKNFKIYSLAFLSLLLISCDPEDETPALNNANLAGTYNVTAFSGNSTETETDNGAVTVESSTFTGSAFNNTTITFTESGFISSTGEFTLTAMISENGMNSTETEITDLDLNGTYSLIGNRIILSDNDDDTIVTIRNFNGNSFDLRYETLEVDTDYRYEAAGTFRLERQ